MNLFRLFYRFRRFCLAISLIMLSTTLSFAETSIHFKPNPKYPSDEGTPPPNKSGGSRGNCPNTDISLTAVVGNSDPLTLTNNQRPSFFIYVPYTADESDYGEFILRDENGQEIWRREFQLLDQPGIVRITFPQTEQPLEIDTTYYWYFEVNCSKAVSSGSGPAFAKGKVKRISDEQIRQQLASAKTSLEQLNIYAENGFWYDTISLLFDQIQNNPQNAQLTNIWTELLSNSDAVGLEEVSQAPIIGDIVTDAQTQ